MDKQIIRTKYKRCPSCNADLDYVGFSFSGAVYYPTNDIRYLSTWAGVCCNYCSLKFEIRGGWLCPKEPFEYSQKTCKDRYWGEKDE